MEAQARMEFVFVVAVWLLLLCYLRKQCKKYHACYLEVLLF